MKFLNFNLVVVVNKNKFLLQRLEGVLRDYCALIHGNNWFHVLNGSKGYFILHCEQCSDIKKLFISETRRRAPRGSPPLPDVRPLSRSRADHDRSTHGGRNHRTQRTGTVARGY